jgi:hypothetical protein
MMVSILWGEKYTPSLGVPIDKELKGLNVKSVPPFKLGGFTELLCPNGTQRFNHELWASDPGRSLAIMRQPSVAQLTNVRKGSNLGSHGIVG